MSDGSALKSNTVLKCKITVKKNGSDYVVTYDPEVITVNDYNTDIHFHIDAKSSDAVEIDDVTYKPDGQTQLVDQKINPNRQELTLKDLNTVKGNFVLAFTYKDKHGAAVNCAMAKALDCESVDVPQINNNPPG